MNSVIKTIYTHLSDESLLTSHFAADADVPVNLVNDGVMKANFIKSDKVSLINQKFFCVKGVTSKNVYWYKKKSTPILPILLAPNKLEVKPKHSKSLNAYRDSSMSESANSSRMGEVAISFQIMTRAEPVAIVKATIASLLAIKAPQDEVIVIDNNHTEKSLYEPLEQYCQSLIHEHVKFVHQDYIAGYKAGALNLALKIMSADCQYIVVVDSDYQALPQARERIVSAINAYPNHALLQFPQYYRDADKPDIHSELNHYFSYHLRRDFNQQYALSTGTFAVINKDALIEMGGWSGASITEDAQMGVLMHLQGAKSQFIPEVVATGLLPQSMSDLICQRRRWVYGNMQVMLNYPSIVRSIRASTNEATDERSLYGFLKYTWLKPAHIRAHLSQLSAWVNFTGGFIVLQAGAVAALIVAKVYHQPSIIEPALTALGICYLSYGVYLSRRLIAYLKDKQPLTMVTAKKLVVSEPLVATTESIGTKHKINRRHFTFANHLLRKVKNLKKRWLSESNCDPYSRRLKAWLVHLNFWELGALSWLPVLWGQKKPFVCTPKISTSPSRFKSLQANFMATPKLLMTLNALTALLVFNHSSALAICAVSVLVLKFAASGVVMMNFTPSDSANDMRASSGVDPEQTNAKWHYQKAI